MLTPHLNPLSWNACTGSPMAKPKDRAAEAILQARREVIARCKIIIAVLGGR